MSTISQEVKKRARGKKRRPAAEARTAPAAGETPEDGVRKRAVSKNRLPEEYNLLRDHLSNFFQSKVQLVRNEQGKGRITIPFASDDELEKLIELFDRLR